MANQSRQIEKAPLSQGHLGKTALCVHSLVCLGILLLLLLLIRWRETPLLLFATVCVSLLNKNRRWSKVTVPLSSAEERGECRLE